MGAGSNRHFGWTNTDDDGGGIAIEACVGDTTGPGHDFVRFTPVYASPQDIPIGVARAWNGIVAAADFVPTGLTDERVAAWGGMIVAAFGETPMGEFNSKWDNDADAILGLYMSVYTARYVAGIE